MSSTSSPKKLLVQFLARAVSSPNQADISILRDSIAAIRDNERLPCLQHTQNKNGATIVHQAALFYKPDIIRCIKCHLKTDEFYELVKQTDNSGRDPLKYAIRSVGKNPLKSVDEMIDLLLEPFDQERRICLIKQGIAGDNSLLIFALKLKKPSLALKFLSYFPKNAVAELLRTKAGGNDTVLHWFASCHDDVDHTERLLRMIPPEELGKLLKMTNDTGHTALHLAGMRSGNAFPLLLSALTQEHVDYFACSHISGFPSMHYLAYYCNENHLVRVLRRLSPGASSDWLFQTNDNGLTLLHHIAATNKAKAVQVIVEHFTLDPFNQLLTVQDKSGKGPLHYSAMAEAWDVFNYLVSILPGDQLAQLLVMPDNNKNTPIQFAAEKGSEAVKTLLLEKSAEIFSHFTSAQQHNAGQRGEARPDKLGQLAVHHGLLEKLSLRQRISELEEEVQIKHFEIEALSTENEKLKTKAASLASGIQVERNKTLSAGNVELVTERGLGEQSSLQSRKGKRAIADANEISQPAHKKTKKSEAETAQVAGGHSGPQAGTSRGSAGQGRDGDTDQEPATDSEDEFVSDDDSSDVGSDYNDNALPEDFWDELLKLCNRVGVVNPQILQGPLDYKHVTVFGVGAAEIEDSDLLEIKAKWPDHCDTISKLEPTSFGRKDAEFCGENSSQLSTFGLAPASMGGVCELLVTVAQQDPQVQKAYLVGAAHCVLSEKLRLQLQDGTPHQRIQEQLERDSRQFHYRVQFGNNGEEYVDAFHIPMFRYRRSAIANVAGAQVGNNIINLQQCRNDVALLRIELSKAEGLHQVFHGLRGRREDLVNITPGKLRKYIRPSENERIDIRVKQHRGYLLPLPNARAQLGPGEVYQLRFVLDNGELQHGDSGSVVYKVGRRNGEPSLRPFGLFVGRSLLDIDLAYGRPIYNAIFLDLAFRDVQAHYRTADIHLFDGHIRPARGARPPR